MEDVSADEGDELSKLEEMICQEGDYDESSEDDEEINVLGGPKKGQWSLSKKILEFYLKAADIELSKDIISSISEKFKASEDLESHFTPPRLPPSLWANIQSSHSDSYKLKYLYKVQENLFLALKPLLNCLSSVDKENKSNVIEAIQLICSSNLQLNRFRRTTIAPHLKIDLRKQVMALPVKHDSFFGEDFGKATDNLIKEQSALDKIIAKKPVNQRISFNNNVNKPNAYASSQRKFRGGKGNVYSFQRGRGGKRGYNYARQGGYKPQPRTYSSGSNAPANSSTPSTSAGTQ